MSARGLPAEKRREAAKKLDRLAADIHKHVEKEGKPKESITQTIRRLRDAAQDTKNGK